MKTAARRRAHGLSLIELMISIAIVTVIGGYLAYFLVIGASAWRAGDTEIQANQESRKGMMSMAKELRQAQDGNLRTTAGA
ncbi:MAG TPA: prepilin-type N-terminal cleavage/methylation domain-containing protein, partial [Candidatus Omnitrophota bacterium]|nr:prepilin-type N-terminal cleavage/methylation domain-containing protein [Candidatus Omnitrophota bacterium]